MPERMGFHPAEKTPESENQNEKNKLLPTDQPEVPGNEFPGKMLEDNNDDGPRPPEADRLIEKESSEGVPSNTKETVSKGHTPESGAESRINEVADRRLREMLEQEERGIKQFIFANEKKMSPEDLANKIGKFSEAKDVLKSLRGLNEVELNKRLDEVGDKLPANKYNALKQAQKLWEEDRKYREARSADTGATKSGAVGDSMKLESAPSDGSKISEAGYPSALSSLEVKSALEGGDAEKEFIKFFKATPEDLSTKIEGYAELNEGQKLLVLENFRQLMLDQVTTDSRSQFEKFRRGDEDAAFVKRMGQKFKRGVLREYYLTNFQKKALGDFKKQNIEEVCPILEGLTRGIKASNLEATKSPDGKIDVNFVTLDGLTKLAEERNVPIYSTPKEKAELEAQIGKFNALATKFGHVPYEWNSPEATKSQRRDFSNAEKEFQKAQHELLGIVNERFGEEEALEYTLDIKHKLDMSHLLSTNPDVEKALAETESRNASGQFIKDTIKGKGFSFSLGIASRSAAYFGFTSVAGVMGTFGAPVLAVGIGGYRAYNRGKETVREQAKLGRRGEQGTEQRAKKRTVMDPDGKPVRGPDGKIVHEVIPDKFITREKRTYVNADVLTKRIESVIKHYETAEGKDKNGKDNKIIATENLERLMQYTDGLMEARLIDFTAWRGKRVDRQEANTLENQLQMKFDFIDKLSRAQGYMGAELNKDRMTIEVDQLLGKRKGDVKEAQDKYVRNEVIKGAAWGLGAAGLGYGVRWVAGGVYGWYRGAPNSGLEFGAEPTPGESRLEVPEELRGGMAKGGGQKNDILDMQSKIEERLNASKGYRGGGRLAEEIKQQEEMSRARTGTSKSTEPYKNRIEIEQHIDDTVKGRAMGREKGVQQMTGDGPRTGQKLAGGGAIEGGTVDRRLADHLGGKPEGIKTGVSEELKEQIAQKEFQSRMETAAVVKKGEGISHAVQRQLRLRAEHDPNVLKKLGLSQEDMKNPAKVNKVIDREMMRVLKEKGYMKPDGTETRIAKPGVRVSLDDKNEIHIEGKGKLTYESPSHLKPKAGGGTPEKYELSKDSMFRPLPHQDVAPNGPSQMPHDITSIEAASKTVESNLKSLYIKPDMYKSLKGQTVYDVLKHAEEYSRDRDWQKLPGVRDSDQLTRYLDVAQRLKSLGMNNTQAKGTTLENVFKAYDLSGKQGVGTQSEWAKEILEKKPGSSPDRIPQRLALEQEPPKGPYKVEVPKAVWRYEDLEKELKGINPQAYQNMKQMKGSGFLNEMNQARQTQNHPLRNLQGSKWEDLERLEKLVKDMGASDTEMKNSSIETMLRNRRLLGQGERPDRAA